MHGSPAGKPGAGYTSPPSGGWVPSAVQCPSLKNHKRWCVFINAPFCSNTELERVCGDCAGPAWTVQFPSALQRGENLFIAQCRRYGNIIAMLLPARPGHLCLEYPATTHRRANEINHEFWTFVFCGEKMRTFEGTDNRNFSCFDILGPSSSIAFLTKTCLFYIWREDENLEKMRLGLNYTVSVLVPNADFCRPLFL